MNDSYSRLTPDVTTYPILYTYYIYTRLLRSSKPDFMKSVSPVDQMSTLQLKLMFGKE